MAERLPRWWLRLLGEVVVWTGLALAFLAMYIGHFDAPTTAIRPHLGLLGTAFTGLLCLRLSVWKWVPGERGPRWIVAACSALLLAVVLFYYGLVLVGLASWGRVITWLLIKSYALQSFDLARALGFSPALIVIAPAGTLLLLVWVMGQWLSPRDWARDLARRISTPAFAVCLVLGCGIVALRLILFLDFPATLQGEPVSLTLFPGRGAHQMQSHLVGGARVIDEAESAARAAYVPNTDAKRRNVILIVGDALRADHMSVYGYARATTPYLEALARHQSIEKVKHTASACAESSCGLMALAVSRYVHELPSHAMSMQEVLRLHRYKVHMILGGDHTNFYGLREAYGEVDSYFDASSQRVRYANDDQLVLDRTALLPPADPAQPVMLQFHLMSSHVLGWRHDTSLQFRPAASYSTWATFGKDFPPGSPEALKATNYYDNGMLQFDRMTGQLLRQLQQKGYLDNAVVVITGDHGEMLGEHGRFGHASQLYDPGLGVPFLLIRYGYGGMPLATSRVASQVDVAPTILAELEIPRPITWRGVPLQSPSKRGVIHFQQASQVGIYDLRRTGRVLKYWKDFGTGREYAFDMTIDPGERHNLIKQANPADIGLWRRQVMASAMILRANDEGTAP